MTVVRRATPLAAALVSVLTGVVGCTSASDGDTDGDDDQQAGEQVELEATEAALAALEAELTDRPDIERAEATYDRSASVPLPSQLYVVVQVTADDPDEASRTVEEVTRTTWASDVPSISTLIVEAVTTDESLRITTADVYGSLSLTRTELSDRFGPREG